MWGWNEQLGGVVGLHRAAVEHPHHLPDSLDRRGFRDGLADDAADAVRLARVARLARSRWPRPARRRSTIFLGLTRRQVPASAPVDLGFDHGVPSVPASRSASVSPTHTIGVSSAFSAARVFAIDGRVATRRSTPECPSSKSGSGTPNRPRVSEWPSTTNVQPASSRNFGRGLAGVRARRLSRSSPAPRDADRSCRSRSAQTGCSAIVGTHSISTSHFRRADRLHDAACQGAGQRRASRCSSSSSPQSWFFLPYFSFSPWAEAPADAKQACLRRLPAKRAYLRPRRRP